MTNVTPSRPKYSTSLSVQSTQNTAPIIEFRCLYTHDLRRKAKRWQDGYLRFHTFNKRIMVYDVPRNFIGDTHWRDEADVCEGDELKLERGVLVEVSEEVARVQQNRNEVLKIVQGRADTPNTERESTTRRPSTSSGIITTKGIVIDSLPQTLASSGTSTGQLRPRSLNSLLGISRGPRGRAILPKESPFAQRQECIRVGAGPEPSSRPAKRRKTTPARQIPKDKVPIVMAGTPKYQQWTSSPVPAPPPSPPQVSEALKRRTSKTRSTDDENVSLPALSRRVVRQPPPRIIEIDSDDGMVSLNPIGQKSLGHQKTSSKTKKATKKKTKPSKKGPSPVEPSIISPPSNRPPANPIRIAPKTARRKLFCAAVPPTDTADGTKAHDSDQSGMLSLAVEKPKDSNKVQDGNSDEPAPKPARKALNFLNFSESDSDDEYFGSLPGVPGALPRQNHNRSLDFHMLSGSNPEVTDHGVFDLTKTRISPGHIIKSSDNTKTCQRDTNMSLLDASPAKNYLQDSQPLFLPSDSSPCSIRTPELPSYTAGSNPETRSARRSAIPLLEEPHSCREEDSNRVQSSQSFMPIIHLLESPEPQQETAKRSATSRDEFLADIDCVPSSETPRVDKSLPDTARHDMPADPSLENSNPEESIPLVTSVGDTTLPNAPLLSKPFKRPTVKKRFDLDKATAGTMALKQIGPGGGILRDSVTISTETEPSRDNVTHGGEIIDRDSEAGPWSIEAFDLFTWRPPPKRAAT